MNNLSLALYSNPGCPYCQRVLRVLDDLQLEIDIRQTMVPEHRQALIEGGGKSMVPCLRIEEQGQVRWLYESLDIIAFLRQLPR